MFHSRLIILALCVLTAMPLAAQDVSLSGQFRERSELDTRSFTSGTSSDVYHWLRMRLRGDAKVTEDILIAVELQDARGYGQTGSTFNQGSPAFDLRQGFAQVSNIGGSVFSAKVGRQVMAYANERFIGGIDWHPYGQSFDAAVLKTDLGAVQVDVFGAGIVRRDNAPYDRDTYMAGTWIAWKPESTTSTLQAFFVHDTPKMPDYRQFRNTAGLHAAGAYFGFDFEIDAAYQFGDLIFATPEKEAMDIMASMVGVRLGYTVASLANLRVAVGYDRLSGDDPANQGTYGSFHTLYGTNHKYYGYMDYFLNIPDNTGFLGLQDAMLLLSVKPHEAITLAADAHMFMTFINPTRIEGAPSNASSDIGMEVDLTVKAKVMQKLLLVGGFSVFNGDADRVVLTGSRRTTNWSYLMAIINF